MTGPPGDLPVDPMDPDLAARAAALRARSRLMCRDFAEDAAQCAALRRQAAALCRDARLLRGADVERQQDTSSAPKAALVAALHRAS